MCQGKDFNTVCGYISTTIPNQGRLDEIAHRVVHLDTKECC